MHSNTLNNDILEIEQSYRDNSADARLGNIVTGFNNAVRPHLVSSSGQNNISSSNDYGFGLNSNMSPAPAPGHQKNYYSNA